MADLLLEALAHDGHDAQVSSGHAIYEVSPTVRYLFWVDSSARDAWYTKITSGTPGTPVLIHAGIVEALHVHAREWTLGNGETEVDIWVGDRADAGGSETLSYYRLDTSDDSLTSEVEVDTTLTWRITGTPADKCVTGGITHEGRLEISYRTNTTGEHHRKTSDDNGATWDSRADSFQADDDVLIFTPGNSSELGAQDDCWYLMDDKSANNLVLRAVDASGASGAGTFSDTVISASGDFTTSTGAINMSAVHRWSDGHILVAMVSEQDTANADWRFYDITNPTTISTVVEFITGQAESIECVLFINQQDDHLYCSMIAGGTFLSAVDIDYMGSDDDGATWASPTQTQFSVDAADDHRSLYGSHSVGDNGGLFAPVWFEDDDNDLFTNTDNEVPIPAAAGVALTGNQPAATGALSSIEYQIALAGNQPAASGTIAAEQTLLRSLAGNQPNATGAISASIVTLVNLAGNQPAPSGDISAIEYQIALAGNQPAPSGVLSSILQTLAISLSGEQPAPSGTIAAIQTLAIALAGNQPNATGTITAIQTLLVALAGNQPAGSGTISASALAAAIVATTGLVSKTVATTGLISKTVATTGEK